MQELAFEVVSFWDHLEASGENNKEDNMKKIVIAVSTILMATSSAFGMSPERGSDRGRDRLVSQTEVIRLGGKEYNGESVIGLIKALRRNGVNMQGKAIKSVTVLAKSREGRGKARLVVNRERSSSVRVKIDTRAGQRGSQRLFRERGGMNSVSLRSSARVDRQLERGVRQAQLVLNGNIKASQIRVELVSRVRSRRPAPKKPRKRSDKEIIGGLIGGIIGDLIEDEIGRGRP